jgi:hypothetical protein
MKNPLREADELFGEDIDDRTNLNVKTANAFDNALNVLNRLKKRYLQEFGPTYKYRIPNNNTKELRILESLGFIIKENKYSTIRSNYIYTEFKTTDGLIKIYYSQFEEPWFETSCYFTPKGRNSSIIGRSIEELFDKIEHEIYKLKKIDYYTLKKQGLNLEEILKKIGINIGDKIRIKASRKHYTTYNEIYKYDSSNEDTLYFSKQYKYESREWSINFNLLEDIKPVKDFYEISFLDLSLEQ